MFRGLFLWRKMLKRGPAGAPNWGPPNPQIIASRQTLSRPFLPLAEQVTSNKLLIHHWLHLPALWYVVVHFNTTGTWWNVFRLCVTDCEQYLSNACPLAGEHKGRFEGWGCISFLQFGQFHLKNRTALLKPSVDFRDQIIQREFRNPSIQ